MVPYVTPVNGREVHVTDALQKPQAARPSASIPASHPQTFPVHAGTDLYSAVVQLRPALLGGLSRATTADIQTLSATDYLYLDSDAASSQTQ